MTLLRHERRTIELRLSKIDTQLTRLPFLDLPPATEKIRLDDLRRQAAEVFATLEADADEYDA